MIDKNNTKTLYSLIKYYFIAFAFVLLLAVGVNYMPITAFAQSETTDEVSLSTEKINPIETTNYPIEKVITDLFGDIEVAHGEFLYNFDQSPDYVYIEFENTGYAVFLKETMELLEFSPTGKLHYPEIMSYKYYGGPGSYYYKKSNYFVDARSNNQFYISESEASTYASDIRGMLKYNYNNRKEKQDIKFDYSMLQNNISQAPQKISESSEGGALINSSSPPYDRDNLIHMKNGTFIPNYRYFLLNPRHGKNETGTCSAIAAQLLLSYHNYYSDRRIIDNKYLNGNSTNEAEKNPNYCNDPMKMDWSTLGTRGIYEDGSDDENSYFSYVVSKIPAHASIFRIKSGINEILTEAANGNIDYSIDMRFNGLYAVDSNLVIPILDSGKPVLLSMQEFLGGTDHALIAYGYNYYWYPNSTDRYFGYITHFGWDENKITYDENGNPNRVTYLDVWVNSMWCQSYLSLNINHLHRYVQYGKEFKCFLCGHRTDAFIGMNSSDRYYEITATFPQNGYAYKDFYTVFISSGRQLFQTFGTLDVKMSLYDSNYNLLIQDDDKGYGLNSFFYYNVEASKPYYLRVEPYNSSASGKVKIGVTPASIVYDKYEAISNMTTDTECSATFPPMIYATRIETFIPKVDGRYEFRTGFVGSTHINTYFYLIDPEKTIPCWYDDDNGGDAQALLRVTLKANKRYLMIISNYSAASNTPSLTLNIRKLSS